MVFPSVYAMACTSSLPNATGIHSNRPARPESRVTNLRVISWMCSSLACRSMPDGLGCAGDLLCPRSIVDVAVSTDDLIDDTILHRLLQNHFIGQCFALSA